MKILVTICLLPLLLCLSHAATPSDPHPVATNDGKVPDEHVEKTIIEIKTTSMTPPTAANVTSKPETTPSVVQNGTDVKPDPANTTNNKTVTDAPSTEKAPVTTKPTDTPASKDTPANKTVTTTSAPVTQKPTEAPKDEKPLHAARGFDGPSFIGGIILTLGLLAIGFMGFKYYKNQTERNYHTL